MTTFINSLLSDTETQKKIYLYVTSHVAVPNAASYDLKLLANLYQNDLKETQVLEAPQSNKSYLPYTSPDSGFIQLLASLLERFEGKVNHVYKDSLGIPTIGIGHQVKTGEAFPSKISNSQILALLEQDIQKFTEGVDKAVKVRLPSTSRAALVSLAFNVGLGDPSFQKIIRLINNNQIYEAISVWKQIVKGTTSSGVLVVIPGLVTRRTIEIMYFKKGLGLN
jgi:lysozyme